MCPITPKIFTGRLCARQRINRRLLSRLPRPAIRNSDRARYIRRSPRCVLIERWNIACRNSRKCRMRPITPKIHTGRLCTRQRIDRRLLRGLARAAIADRNRPRHIRRRPRRALVEHRNVTRLNCGECRMRPIAPKIFTCRLRTSQRIDRRLLRGLTCPAIADGNRPRYIRGCTRRALVERWNIACLNGRACPRRAVASQIVTTRPARCETRPAIGNRDRPRHIRRCPRRVLVERRNIARLNSRKCRMRPIAPKIFSSGLASRQRIDRCLLRCLPSSAITDSDSTRYIRRRPRRTLIERWNIACRNSRKRRMCPIAPEIFTGRLRARERIDRRLLRGLPSAAIADSNRPRDIRSCPCRVLVERRNIARLNSRKCSMRPIAPKIFSSRLASRQRINRRLLRCLPSATIADRNRPRDIRSRPCRVLVERWNIACLNGRACPRRAVASQIVTTRPARCETRPAIGNRDRPRHIRRCPRRALIERRNIASRNGRKRRMRPITPKIHTGRLCTRQRIDRRLLRGLTRAAICNSNCARHIRRCPRRVLVECWNVTCLNGGAYPQRAVAP